MTVMAWVGVALAFVAVCVAAGWGCDVIEGRMRAKRQQRRVPTTFGEALQPGRFVSLRGRICEVLGTRSGRLTLQWDARDGRAVRGRHTWRSLERLWALGQLKPCG